MEIWKAIPNYEGYEVSNLGNVRCWNSHNGKGCKSNKPRTLKLSKFADSDYLRVGIRNTLTQKIQTRRVHQLVLEAFVGPKPTAKPIVMHLDDNCANNKLTNLKWATSQDNSNDMCNKGRSKSGDAHPRIVVSEKQRSLILKMHSLNKTRGSKKRIADKLNVSVTNVYQIIRRAEALTV